MSYPLDFEIIDELVRFDGSTPPEPGTRLIVTDGDGCGAWLCEIEAVSTTEVGSFTTTEDGWSVELRVLPWPDGWSVHKRGDGHEIHRPTNMKEDDQ